MSDRRLTDAQISTALRTHLPAGAPAGARRMLRDAVEATPQQRPLLPVLGFGPTFSPIGLRSGLLLLAALLLAALLAGLAAAGAWRVFLKGGTGWIAYSTDGHALADSVNGSDLYLVRPGENPILVAGRENGTARNACPRFSPDGTRLAYGVSSSTGIAIIVRGVGPLGVTSEAVRIAVPTGGLPPCAQWSADGTRLAYLDGGAEVVRGLDGSTLAPAPGDPSAADLASPTDGQAQLLSPSGKRAAHVTGDGGCCQLVVARPDGTDAQVIPLDYSPYAIAAWSPDSSRVLLMEDVSGTDFTMHEVDIRSGAQSVVVSTVRTNGARSWPGWGDVSWQSVLP